MTKLIITVTRPNGQIETTEWSKDFCKSMAQGIYDATIKAARGTVETIKGVYDYNGNEVTAVFKREGSQMIEVTEFPTANPAEDKYNKGLSLIAKGHATNDYSLVVEGERLISTSNYHPMVDTEAKKAHAEQVKKDAEYHFRYFD